jgi:hypothetical protein
VKLGDDRTVVLKARFRQTRLYQAAVLAPVGGAAFLLGNARRYAVDLGLAPILLGAAFLLVVAVAFSWLNWRCPACREQLGLRWNPHHCPGCGFILGSR